MNSNDHFARVDFALAAAWAKDGDVPIAVLRAGCGAATTREIIACAKNWADAKRAIEQAGLGGRYSECFVGRDGDQPVFVVPGQVHS